jgi:diguanylate cyclase (GGDEF)-like protein
MRVKATRAAEPAGPSDADTAAAPASLLAPVEAIYAAARQDYLDSLPIGAAVICLAPDGSACIDIANSDFRSISGWGEADGRSIEEVAFLRESGLKDQILSFLESGEQVRHFTSGDGRNVGGRHFEVRLGRINRFPALGTRCLLSLNDRTAQVETEKSLRSEMLHDSLTGLPNRIAFGEKVEAILGDPSFREGSHAVLVIDMTRFSRVNECMGAIAGDELLITFARRLFSALRPSDVLARTGGDEFGVLVRLERGIEDAIQVAQRIEGVLAQPFRLSELEIRVECAIGCALVSRSVELSDEVLRNAQFALKRAKASGHTEIYEAGEAQAARRRFSIETELRRAIENDDLTLSFQPIVELATGRVSSFEALARWDHPEQGQISPNEFIPVAEESGLVVALGRWAMEAAAEALAAWDAEAKRRVPVSIAVNVSAVQIARDDVPAMAAAALQRAGIKGSRLTVELTESAIVRDPARASEVLGALKEMNARVAMDDFGTGYTSLAYLQRLPIDILKIDRSFVTGMLDDRDATAIVRAILSLSTALGMETTAEGIESAELARALTAMGCSHGQGYHFSEALDRDAALAYWLERST